MISFSAIFVGLLLDYAENATNSILTTLKPPMKIDSTDKALQCKL